MAETSIDSLRQAAQISCAQCSVKAYHMRQQAKACNTQAEQLEREAYAWEGQAEAYAEVQKLQPQMKEAN